MCRKDNSYQKSGGGNTVFVKGFDRSLDENQVYLSIDISFFFLIFHTVRPSYPVFLF
jgi:hypothetical protein